MRKTILFRESQNFYLQIQITDTDTDTSICYIQRENV